MRVPEYTIDMDWLAQKDHGLDDVIPNAKYRAEFGDGPVPITHVEHLYWRDSNDGEDHVQALFDTLAIFDEGVRRFGRVDAPHVASLMKEYRICIAQAMDQSLQPKRGYKRDGPQEPRRSDDGRSQQIVRELVQAGLRVNVILNLVRSNQFKAEFPGIYAMEYRAREKFDDAVLAGANWHKANETAKLHPNVARCWAVQRGKLLNEAEAREEITYWMIQQEREAEGTGRVYHSRKAINRAMYAKYPNVWFNSTTVMRDTADVREGLVPLPEKRDSWTKPNW